MIRAEDTEYEDHVLDAVQPCAGGWKITHDHTSVPPPPEKKK